MNDSVFLIGPKAPIAAASAADDARPPRRATRSPDRTLLPIASHAQKVLARLRRTGQILRADAGLSAEDAKVLAETERWSARTAAVAHLVVVLVIAAVVLLAFRTEDHGDLTVAGLLLADLAVSLCCIPLARHVRLGTWLPWAAGLLDVGVLIGVVVETVRFQATLPGPFRPSLVGIWGIFLSLSLSAMRGRPVLLFVQTLLFTVGLTYVATGLAAEMHVPSSNGSPAVFFDPAQSTIRVAVVAIAGAMLIIITLRARINLRHAIVAARRAANLSRYLAPSVASVVADADDAALRQGRQQNVAVLFADLRGFSSLAETMPPREIADFLNAFRRLAVAAVASEGGVIDKFVGDEVMGLFGVPAASSRDAGRAIRAAQKLLTSVRTWNDERRSAGLPPVSIGIGIHYGPVFAGVLGDDRLEFTVLGSTVNIARRLEELTKSLGHDCIVSAWALRAARTEQPGDWSCRGLPAQTIRGHSDPVGIFALVA